MLRSVTNGADPMIFKKPTIKKDTEGFKPKSILQPIESKREKDVRFSEQLRKNSSYSYN